MYTVKEAVDILGVSPHTVHYNADQGLVPGCARDAAAGNRAFDDMAMEWLFVTGCTKGMGTDRCTSIRDICAATVELMDEMLPVPRTIDFES